MNALESAEQVAKRAYEVARLRRGALRATLLTAPLVLLALVLVGREGAPPLLGLFVVWAVLEWRGGAWLRGARLGVPAGVLAWLVPGAALESCCRIGCAVTGGACCGVSGACTMFGILLGAAVGVALTRKSATWAKGKVPLEAVAGGTVGLLAAAGPRCATLVLSESVGLLLGVLAGTGIATAIGLALRPRTA